MAKQPVSTKRRFLVFATQDVVVKLTINEPLDTYQVLRGKIVRPIRSLEEHDLYHLFQDNNGGWLVIKPRYEGEQVEEVYLGRRIQVAIASIADQNVIHSDYFRLTQVNYFGAGSITISED